MGLAPEQPRRFIECSNTDTEINGKARLKMKYNLQSARGRGFTLIELLALLGIMGLFATTVLPGYSHTRNRSQDVIDFYNNKELMAAANMYAADQNDLLPGCGWGTADDAWAYAKNIPASYAGQVTALENGQLFPYIKNQRVFMCPIDVSNNLFSVRGIRITSYYWNGAVGGYGTLLTPNGHGSYKAALFKPNAIIQWEADGSQPFYWNDASAFPDEGASNRHGNGATVGLLSGGVQRIPLNLWFTPRYAGYNGARGKSIPSWLLPNPFWCNPGVTSGLSPN